MGIHYTKPKRLFVGGEGSAKEPSSSLDETHHPINGAVIVLLGAIPGNETHNLSLQPLYYASPTHIHYSPWPLTDHTTARRRFGRLGTTGGGREEGSFIVTLFSLEGDLIVGGCWSYNNVLYNSIPFPPPDGRLLTCCLPGLSIFPPRRRRRLWTELKIEERS